MTNQRTMKKTYILGMAKSSMTLKQGGISRSIELDVLRIIYCIEKFNQEKKQAKGFLLVYNDEMKNRIENNWLTKYKTSNPDNIEIITFEHKLTTNEERIIKKEKVGNSKFNSSSATKSAEITERILKEQIKLRYKNLTELDKHTAPIDINWDFYGTGE